MLSIDHIDVMAACLSIAVGGDGSLKGVAIQAFKCIDCRVTIIPRIIRHFIFILLVTRYSAQAYEGFITPTSMYGIPPH